MNRVRLLASILAALTISACTTIDADRRVVEIRELAASGGSGIVAEAAAGGCSITTTPEPVAGTLDAQFDGSKCSVRYTSGSD